jgi:phosphohistidine phosphatase
MAGLRLYFLRHGKALARSDWQDDDALRPLTPDGEEEVRRVGAALAALGVTPDTLVSSPLARARRTAELVADTLGVAPVFDERLAPGFEVEALAGLVAGLGPVAAVVLVGHEPDFSSVVRALTGGAVVCKKGGVARVDVDDAGLGGGRLVWLLPPTVLARE